jgi:zona occludens toxin
MYSACISSIDRPGEPQSSGLGRYKPDIYKYYQSHTKNENVGLPGVELRADKRGTIWSHWYIRYLMPVVFLCSIWAVYEFYYIYKVKYSAKPPTSQVQPLQLQPPTSNILSVPSGQVLPAVQKIYSKRYRIAGQVNADGILKVYVHDSTQPGLIIMGAGDCSIGDMRQTQCKVDGEIVTIATGVRPVKPKPTETDFKQLVPTVAAVDAVK